MQPGPEWPTRKPRRPVLPALRGLRSSETQRGRCWVVLAGQREREACGGELGALPAHGGAVWGRQV